MNIVSALELIGVASALLAAVALAAGWKRSSHGDIRLWLAGLIGLTLFINFTNLLEWAGIVVFLDRIEDYITVLQPWMWGVLFYMFLSRINQKALEAKSREHTRAVRELRESESRFRQLFDNTPNISIQGYTPDGTIHYWNDASEKLYGYTRSEAIGNDLVELIIPPEMRDEVRQGIQHSGQTGEVPPPGELELMAKDGSSVPVISSHAIVERSDRDPLLFCLDLDIAEQKNVQEALERSEEKFREIFHNANDAMYLHEVRADDSLGLFIEVNRVACEMLGYSRKEFLSMTPKDIDPPGKMEELEKVTGSLLSQGNVTFESEHVTKDGDAVPVEISSDLFHLAGQRLVLSIARDITDRRETEQALQSSLAEKEVLLREVHHRVKNNLQVINSLLRLQARQFDDEHLSKALNESRNRIQAMAVLHETLYGMEDVAQIDFRKYVRRLVREVSSTYGRVGAEITFDIQIEDINLTINRATPCGQIIAELISNSLKHGFPDNAPKAPRIGVHLQTTDDGMVQLEVHDNGLGLPADMESAPTDSLGLRLVKMLAEDQLGGVVEWRNDNGTWVQITFPHG